MNSTSSLTPAATGVTASASPHPSVGFKDWAFICAALGQGRQSLILRKGGIAEGREGFRFKHEEFFLFPTQFHQQAERIRPEELSALDPVTAPPAGTVEIRYFFVLEGAVWIDDWTTIARLKPFHLWHEDVVRERYGYGDERGLQCAFGRVHRLEPRWTFPERPAYGGCRSWVTLPDFPAATLSVTAVIDDARHETAMRAIRAALDLS